MFRFTQRSPQSSQMKKRRCLNSAIFAFLTCCVFTAAMTLRVMSIRWEETVNLRISQDTSFLAQQIEPCKRNHVVRATNCFEILPTKATNEGQGESSCLRQDNKALVVYFLGTEAENSSRIQNFGNLRHFVRNGVYESGFSSSLHTGVDFYFVSIAAGLTKVELLAIAEGGQHVLLLVPPGPCDLCAHSHALRYIGLDKVTCTYRTVVMLNSGVRGPFLSGKSSHWIDVVTAAGREEFPGASCPDPAVSNLRVFSVAVSWERQMHSQSYFSAYPREAVKVVTKLYGDSCSKKKKGCAFQGEVMTLSMLLEKNITTYSSSQGFVVESQDRAREYRKNHELHPKNPTLGYIDPCDSVFIKAGGLVFRAGLIPKQVLWRASNLSAISHRAQAGPGFSFSKFPDQNKVRQFLGVDRDAIGL
uniref:Uncharacterized protein n=1 Tax=Hemiselmis tepida TaxID=464990 RepID=A0A7S0VL25_9CRYP|mmetsp:Transcript_19032/g.48020  ORF Transcript_19032/g.48020 Transcript_19032/m.48020 type:complete len:417 (+) Transcript_19032:3-1253(+)